MVLNSNNKDNSNKIHCLLIPHLSNNNSQTNNNKVVCLVLINYKIRHNNQILNNKRVCLDNNNQLLKINQVKHKMEDFLGINHRFHRILQIKELNQIKLKVEDFLGLKLNLHRVTQIKELNQIKLKAEDFLDLKLHREMLLKENLHLHYLEELNLLWQQTIKTPHNLLQEDYLAMPQIKPHKLNNLLLLSNHNNNNNNNSNSLRINSKIRNKLLHYLEDNHQINLFQVLTNKIPYSNNLKLLLIQPKPELHPQINRAQLLNPQEAYLVIKVQNKVYQKVKVGFLELLNLFHLQHKLNLLLLIFHLPSILKQELVIKNSKLINNHNQLV